ncbi:hypothetical protein LCGC14_1645040 [marine sediment metagenome]|uniref:Portal protein n=1 Tax=marine sediment metagenome TaxID=412755 RepID=A0A0F9IL07_9ZZZZ
MAGNFFDNARDRFFRGPETESATSDRLRAEIRNPLNYPQGHEEWVAWYNFRFDAYVGQPYTTEQVINLRGFRALDESGEIIGIMQRVTRDVQHVVDTDAQALAGREWMLEIDDPDGSAATGDSPEAIARLEAGKAVWSRSKVQEEKGSWARVGASLGDIMFEPVRTNGKAPFETKIVAYDPRHVRLEYDDATGTVLEKATITIPFFDAPDISAMGEVVDAPTGHVYQRILTWEDITETLDGKDTGQSGPHKLGVVPMVHLPFIKYVEPDHGLWAASGLDMALVLIDSLMTQVQAIGNRFANPILAAIGVKVEAGADLLKVGRIASGIPLGGDLKYVEATMTGLATLLAAAQAELEQVRETLPEFLFTESGANSSGSALNFRAAAFVLKMNEVRGRWYSGFARLVEMAVALDENRALDETDTMLKVTSQPVLPVNVESELKVINEARDKGGLLQADYVGHLKRLGIVPANVDAAQYAEAVKAEAAGAQSGETEALLRLIKATEEMRVRGEEGGEDEGGDETGEGTA